MTDWKPDICIYHGNCLDGFGAAWAIWKRWGNACDFRAGFHGVGLPLEPFTIIGKNILFVDFSAPPAVLEAISSEAASVVVLDHHKTAKAELQPYICKGPVEDFGLRLAERAAAGLPPIVAYFEDDYSGAVMAWEFACMGEECHVPELLKFIQDRDLWRFNYGDQTRHVVAALQTYPMEFAVWDGLIRKTDDLIVEGKFLLRAHNISVEKILEFAHYRDVDGYIVPAVNAPYQFASDVGNELLKRYPKAEFAASFFTPTVGKTQWSLRSEDSRIDVSVIARARGGGGHRNAAGFTERT